MYFKDGQYYPATSPFILTKDGELQYFSDTGATTDLILDRKYPYFPINKVNATPMIGGKFQLANNTDFNDSITIFTVSQLPVKFEQIFVSSKNKYRYVRYLTATHQKTNLAELEVYALSGNKETKLSGKIIGAPVMPPDVGNPFQNAFDGDPETYFFGNPDSVSWAGLDLERAVLISKIRFCPRSDVNFIVVGNKYELCYWNGEKWHAIEQQIAVDQTLTFKRVPKNQVYILHNLSHGTQERMFTYTNGQQIWW